MDISKRLSALRASKELSQGDIERRRESHVCMEGADAFDTGFASSA
jgi:hypothetical protein